MCMGLPMHVERVGEGWADCRGRGEQRRVRTAIVGALEPGDWVLVFLGSAIERLDATRALEIDQTLDLLQAALEGRDAAGAEPGFALPSRFDAAGLAELTGAPIPREHSERSR